MGADPNAGLRDLRPFIDQFKTVIDEAASIVTSRDEEGRNAGLQIEEQFTPSGAETSSIFIIEIIEMKLKRAKSYYIAGNWPKFVEELQDCINYAAFPIVIEDQPGEAHLRGVWQAENHG